MIFFINANLTSLVIMPCSAGPSGIPKQLYFLQLNSGKQRQSAVFSLAKPSVLQDFCGETTSRSLLICGKQQKQRGALPKHTLPKHTLPKRETTNASEH